MAKSSLKPNERPQSVKQAYAIIAKLRGLDMQSKVADSLPVAALNVKIADCEDVKDDLLALNVLLRLMLNERLNNKGFEKKRFRRYRNARAREFRNILREHGFTPNVLRVIRVVSEGDNIAAGKSGIIDMTFEAAVAAIDRIKTVFVKAKEAVATEGKKEIR